MIHSYFTDGMFEFAKIFLESFKITNGEQENIVFSTRNLSYEQITELKDLYSRLKIYNIYFNYNEISKRIAIPKSVLLTHKREVENNHVTDGNKIWKLIIAGEDRIKDLFNIMLNRSHQGDIIIHFDIDTLFRKPLSPIYPLAEKNDLCLLIRHNLMPYKARITISTIGVNVNRRTINFFSKWVGIINTIHPQARPIGFGQLSCWFAYCKCPDLKICKLDNRFGYPGLKKRSGIVWSGAVNKMKKSDCIDFFKKQLPSLAA
jgi:hypothetical protein